MVLFSSNLVVSHGVGLRAVAFSFFENFFEKQRLFFGSKSFFGCSSLYWSRLSWFLLVNVSVILVAIKQYIIFSSFHMYIVQHQFKFINEIQTAYYNIGFSSLSWSRLPSTWFLLLTASVILVAIKKYIIFSSLDTYIARHQFKLKNEIESVLLIPLVWFVRFLQLGQCSVDWFGSFAPLLLSSHTIYNHCIVFCCFILLFFISYVYELLFSDATKK